MEDSPYSTSPTLSIALQNLTSSSSVYAYITGQAIDNNYSVFLLQADGVTPYYPTSPSLVTSPLLADCSISLGAPGSTRTVIIPRIAGGRIWFCVNDKLTFLLNPGPGLVEPSVSNPADPNYNKLWSFCEFTFNSTQVFVNISYVDFVSLPINLTLVSTTGATQHVSGTSSTGLQLISSNLIAQNANDGKGWDKLVVRKPDGSLLRALSPNTAMVMNPSLFEHYYDRYVDAVWNRYTTQDLRIDTQAQWGIVVGRVVNGVLTFRGIGSFTKPTARDIFSCSTGPFAVSTPVMGAIAARLSAAFNRSTLLKDVNVFPDGEAVSMYYGELITNWYSRIVHAGNVDGRGYAFPYDDVGAGGTDDQSGSIADGTPAVLIVGVGGA